MINLLPPVKRQGLSFARRNSTLAKWAIYLVVGLMGTVLVTAAGEAYNYHQINVYTKQNQTAQEQLNQQKLTETQNQVSTMSADIKLALQVLSRQVLFSDLITQIGKAMPDGAALASLSIEKLQGAIDLNAIAKNYKTASQIQVNLADPSNQIFAKADIQNITCNNKAATNGYPCQVAIRALFASNNPFLFIKSKPTGASQ